MSLAPAALAAALVLGSSAWAQSTAPSPQESARSFGPLLPRDGPDAAVVRGGLVYSNYCVTCHGVNADGNGRAARLYNPRPANLRTSDKNDAYVLLIIREGGQALGRSEFMPPWGAELTEEQMRDVTTYLRAINVRTASR